MYFKCLLIRHNLASEPPTQTNLKLYYFVLKRLRLHAGANTGGGLGKLPPFSAMGNFRLKGNTPKLMFQ